MYFDPRDQGSCKKMAGQIPVSSVHVGVNQGNIVAGQAGSRRGRVLITQYRPGVIAQPMRADVVPTVSSNPAVRPVFEKILIKACAKSPPKREKTFTLRRIYTGKVSTVTDLKKEIVRQHCEDVIDWEEFDVGYTCGSDKVIHIRSKEDLKEVWRDFLKKGEKMKLWCDGLRVSRKRSRTDDDEELPKAKKKTNAEERADKYQEYFDSLKERYKNKYSEMQYRMWTEMLLNGMHRDGMEKPPKSSLFKRAGPDCSPVKKDSTGQAATQAALSQVSAALVACNSKSSPLSSTSPASKIIENRSKCYKQISELQNLKMQGFLADEEFERERSAIMDILTGLNKK